MIPAQATADVGPNDTKGVEVFLNDTVLPAMVNFIAVFTLPEVLMAEDSHRECKSPMVAPTP